jgi:peroxiredoxin
MREDIIVGATFPDYQLEDQAGVLRKLSELQSSNPMVLHLSRGSYDPKEHRFLKNLVDSYPEFRVAYTRLVVISTDNPLNLNEFRNSLGAQWPFLGDPERTVQRDLDIEEFTDPHNPMIPHTFVLEPGLRIFSIYVGYWYWGRPTMDELHVDLRAVPQKTRRDFDLGAPGLREAWDRGIETCFLSIHSIHRSDSPRARPSGSNVATSSDAVESDRRPEHLDIDCRPVGQPNYRRCQNG